MWFYNYEFSCQTCWVKHSMPKNAHISYDSAINVYEAYPAEYKRYSKHTTSDDKTVYPCWRGAVDDVDLRQGCNRND